MKKVNFAPTTTTTTNSTNTLTNKQPSVTNTNNITHYVQIAPNVYKFCKK